MIAMFIMKMVALSAIIWIKTYKITSRGRDRASGVRWRNHERGVKWATALTLPVLALTAAALGAAAGLSR